MRKNELLINAKIEGKMEGNFMSKGTPKSLGRLHKKMWQKY